jgi:hypothetical protein
MAAVRRQHKAGVSRQDSRLSVKSLIESIENATKQAKAGECVMCETVNNRRKAKSWHPPESNEEERRKPVSTVPRFEYQSEVLLLHQDIQYKNEENYTRGFVL